ncbi:hypothetical protein ACVL92_006045 [Bradyrhizobium liaoningense]
MMLAGVLPSIARRAVATTSSTSAHFPSGDLPKCGAISSGITSARQAENSGKDIVLMTPVMPTASSHRAGPANSDSSLSGFSA